jgi:hypothetical protein
MRIPDDIKKCVCFVGFINQKSPDQSEYIGTGFLVGVKGSLPGSKFIYLVTAKHVASRLETAKEVVMRFNTKTGSSIELVAKNGEMRWHYHLSDEAADVAVAAVGIDAKTFDFTSILPEMFVDPEDIIPHGIGAGDTVVITGLFSYHAGLEKNLPIVRTGNIAMMPDERIHTKDFGKMEAYLIEARSIGGLSGSPVFVLKELYPGVLPEKDLTKISTHRIFLLGLIQGHWNLKEGSEITAISQDAFGERINTGIAIVTPAHKIKEILNSDALTTERVKIERSILEEENPGSDTK